MKSFSIHFRVFIVSGLLIICVGLPAQYTVRDTDSLRLNAEYWSGQARSEHRDTQFLIALRFHFYSKCISSQEDMGSLLDSIDRYSRSLTWSKARAFYYGCLGVVQIKKSNYTASLEAFEKAADIFKSQNDLYWLSYAYENICVVQSRIFELQDEVDTSLLNVFEKNVREIIEVVTTGSIKSQPLPGGRRIENVLTSAYNFLAKIFIKKNKVDSAQYYLNKSYLLANRLGLNFQAISAYYDWLDNNITNKILPIEKQNFDHLDSLVNVYKLPSYNSLSYFLKAKFAVNNGKDLVALQMIDSALIQHHEPLDNHVLHKIYLLQWEIAKKNKKFEIALRAQENLNKINTLLKSEELHSKIIEINYQYEQEKLRNQLQSLQLEESIAKEKKSRIVRNLVFGFSILIFILLGYLFFLNTRLKYRHTLLQIKNEEISEALVKGQNLERNRVASELHDNLNTKLAALSWQLQAIDAGNLSDKNNNIVSKSILLTDEIYQDVRNISHKLNPSELETYGLDIAIGRLVNSVNIQSKIRINYTVNDRMCILPKPKEYHILSICQELVQNIIKHSQATAANIDLYYHTKGLRVTVIDNGKGWDSNIKSEGIGWQNIRDRIKTIDGKIQIFSNEKPGSRVVVEVSNL